MPQLLLTLILAAAISSCSDLPEVVEPPAEPPIDEVDSPESPRPVGVYEFTVSGIGAAEMAASSDPVVLGDMTAVGPDLEFERTSVTSFVDGPRDGDGQRYVTITYRVRNGTGAPVNNVTLIPNTTSGTIDGTPWLTLKLFDNTDADPSLAEAIVPTGAVALGEDLELRSLYPDVLQVFDESELDEFPLPEGVTGLFPYGFMVRHRDQVATTRTIPAAADANTFDGVLTFAFRFPRTASNSTDPFSFTFWATAYEDSDTRITESMEEAADTAAVRRLRERAAALGVSTTTVLAGSMAPDASVPDYPGQRLICSVRIAGPTGAPVTDIRAPAAFSHFMLMRPGEAMDPCAPGFRSGAAERPATNVPFPIEVTAVDRYGNVKAAASETVRLEQESGPAATIGTESALTGGSATIPVTYSDYGTSSLVAIGTRNRGWQTLPVAGVTRVWTAGAGTSAWSTGENWELGAAPMQRDSVLIPAAAPHMPLLSADAAVLGVTVEDGATLAVGSYDLSAGGSVATGSTGGITGTGRLVLTGSEEDVRGVVPSLHVTGTYSLSGALSTRAPLRVDLGRLTSQGYRIRTTSY